jgi:hypothetical protein
MFPTRRAEWSPDNPHYDHVVYFYQSGRFEKYLQHPKDLLALASYGPIAGYDFTSDLVARRPGYRPQSVEQILAHGYLVFPHSDPAEAILSDKKGTAWLGLDDVIAQIQHRYEVYARNIYDLQISKCAAVNSLYTHEAWHGPSNSRIEYSVQKRLDRLYQSERDERINLWRDISRLKLLLPERAQAYLAAYRKVSLLEESGGDAP